MFRYCFTDRAICSHLLTFIQYVYHFLVLEDQNVASMAVGNGGSPRDGGRTPDRSQSESPHGTHPSGSPQGLTPPYLLGRGKGRGKGRGSGHGIGHGKGRGRGRGRGVSPEMALGSSGEEKRPGHHDPPPG